MCKILIVDDEQLIRQGIKHYLHWEQEGFRIVGEASNGKEALELIETTQPHIVLTDIVMPVMDGEELTRAIKAAYPDIEVIVLSSFGEFDYVRSTFQSGVADYILKPKLESQQLLKVLRTSAGKVMSVRSSKSPAGIPLSLDLMIEKQIAGYDAPIDEAVVKAAFPHDRFLLLGMDIKHAAADADDPIAGFLHRLEAALQSKLPSAVCKPTIAEPRLIAVVINAADGLHEGIYRAIADLADDWHRSVPGLRMAMSEPFADFGQLGTVYKESLLKLLSYGFYLPDKRLIVERELPRPAPTVGKFQLDRFADGLKRGRFDATWQQLKDHVIALTGCYAMDVFEYKSFLSNVIFNITVLLGNMNYDVKKLDQVKYAYFNGISQSRHAQEAAETLFAFIAEAENAIGVSLQPSGGGNMKKLLEYIEQHYDQPLSLKDMANHFHFNPSYLSSYFTSHNKEGFVEYLNKIRTDKAAELLRKDEDSISEISGKVGYSDHSYFCKVFKKMTGLSPSQYRRQHLNAGKE